MTEVLGSPIAAIALLFAVGIVALFPLTGDWFGQAKNWVVVYVLVSFGVRPIVLLTSAPGTLDLFRIAPPGPSLAMDVTVATYESVIGLALFVALYWLWRRRVSGGESSTTTYELKLGRAALVVVVALVVLPITELLYLRAHANPTAGGTFALTLPANAAAGVGAIAAFLFWRHMRRVAPLLALCAANAAANLALFGAKFSALVLTAGLMLGLLDRVRPRSNGKRRLWLPAGALSLFALVVLLIFTAPFSVRGMSPAGRLVLGAEAIASRSYGTDALIGINHYQSEGHSLLWGSSFAEVAISWIPRQLWPAKPVSFTERLGQGPFSYSRQAGHVFFAPSYGGEWLLNFGLPGFLAGWMLFGMLTGYVDRRIPMPLRLAWLIVLAHTVEGGLVTQFWLGLPLLVGGRLALTRAPSASPDQAAPPSAALRLLRRLVRNGVIRHGYSWLLVALPPVTWGGASLRLDTEAGPMVLPTDDRGAASLVCLGHVGEKRETALIRALARTSGVMLDIGAHFGWYARLMAQEAPSGKVFAFEPDPKTYAYLLANSSAYPNVQCVELAVAASDGEGQLWRSGSSNLNSAVRRVGTGIPVGLRTLDRFCRERRLDVVDLVKCDVEGGEAAVLNGARSLLQSARPPIWMLEVVDPFMREAMVSGTDLLSKFNDGAREWSLFTQDAAGVPVRIHQLSERMLGSNVFFVPPERLADFERAAGLVRQKAAL